MGAGENACYPVPAQGCDRWAEFQLDHANHLQLQIALKTGTGLSQVSPVIDLFAGKGASRMEEKKRGKGS